MLSRPAALGTSELFLAFQENLSRVADAERPVLILGERGTGKELAAQHLHFLSRRWDKPFLTLLCPSLSATLLESELFGHEAGAFTGAVGRRLGLFERAHGGTLFLDEVADMPLPLQDKLLRVLEYGTLERVGGSATVQVDVLVLAATNQDMRQLAASGRFRADLLDRLAFAVVHVPPLRLRQEDILLLARHFASRMALELGLPGADQPPEFGDFALAQMAGYPWPGNVRELKNVVERSLLAHKDGLVKPLDYLILDPFQAPWGEEGPARESASADAAAPTPALLPQGFRLNEAVADMERRAVEQALAQARHHQGQAAALLGLSYHQFRALYRKYER